MASREGVEKMTNAAKKFVAICHPAGHSPRLFVAVLIPKIFSL
jgi:hypothetical protein